LAQGVGETGGLPASGMVVCAKKELVASARGIMGCDYLHFAAKDSLSKMGKEERSYRKAAGITEEPVQDGSVLYCHDYAERIFLNDTAACIWKNICEGRALSDIISVMMREYGVDERTARIDVISTIKHLRSLGLIEDNV
jgi:hypothetical protein